MVSKGFFPGCEEAKEAWPRGCQSWVSTMFSKRAASRLMSGTTSSPFGTARAPPGQKSFCTSTTMRHEAISVFRNGEPAGDFPLRQDHQLAGSRGYAGECRNRRAMRDQHEIRFPGLFCDQSAQF